MSNGRSKMGFLVLGSLGGILLIAAFMVHVAVQRQAVISERLTIREW